MNRTERLTTRVIALTIAFVVGAQLGMKQERDNRPLCICDESRDYAAGYLDAWTKAMEAQDSLIAAADSLAKQTGGPQ